MSASFLEAARRRHDDALDVETAEKFVWRELASEILSHLDAAALARAAPTCKLFNNSLEQSVRMRARKFLA